MPMYDMARELVALLAGNDLPSFNYVPNCHFQRQIQPWRYYNAPTDSLTPG